MKYQVLLNKNGKVEDVIVEAKNATEAKIIAKQQNSKSKVVGVTEKDT